MKRATLPQSLDPADLPRDLPRFRHWFRYPLHRHDFQPLCAVRDERLLGYYTAKPLYGLLDAAGRVDKSAGFNGEIAGVFVPSPARSWRQAELFFTKMPKAQVARPDGQRNWPAIHAAAEHALHERLG
ncbi:hypothetical protein [Thermomonas sp.]|uniref:hypothetical protein n=1 Tax=Thermomonas sp. TaxID=1971895 RepID=UPI002488FF40|nr:hypothetical protein [Thermomonas sp.]MDI1252198.1 hypothetical protein [Thermomonas sp.]